MKKEWQKLIEDLVDSGYLQTPALIEAFKKIDRADFVPEEMKDLAYLNEALSIGYGQTVSQPLTVAFMLERLQPRPGEKILDIGTGSGWKAALLAYVVSQESSRDKIQKTNGKVVSVEVVPELHQMAQKNLSKPNFTLYDSVKLVLGNGKDGYAPEAPYDRIISGAGAVEVPQSWKKQLKVGGRLLTPLRSNVIFQLDKISEDKFEEKEYPGFVFVPLV